MGKSLKILLFQPLFKDLTKIDSNIILPKKLEDIMYCEKVSKIISLAVLSSPFILSPFTPQIPDSAIAEYPSWGILRENTDGFIYVDVDDNYIHELIHFIEGEGYQEPPYFGGSELVGAHISVVYANEERMGSLAEEGQIIHFTPRECRVVHPPHWNGVEDVYLIEVDAPELDLIRAKYGLPKVEFGYHITIGIKPKY